MKTPCPYTLHTYIQHTYIANETTIPLYNFVSFTKWKHHAYIHYIHYIQYTYVANVPEHRLFRIFCRLGPRANLPRIIHLMMMWHVWWCDMCVMMWHVCDDVACVWWCGMCVMMWHVCDHVTCVWWCDMCVMMWHVCDHVTCVWWCDLSRCSSTN